MTKESATNQPAILRNNGSGAVKLITPVTPTQTTVIFDSESTEGMRKVLQGSGIHFTLTNVGKNSTNTVVALDATQSQTIDLLAQDPFLLPDRTKLEDAVSSNHFLNEDAVSFVTSLREPGPSRGRRNGPRYSGSDSKSPYSR